MPFFWPKISVFGQKSDFCHTTPILVDDPFLALGMTVNFPHWEQFFDFPFRSYSCFRKKILLTAQKVFPLPTVGFYCTVKALALSASRAGLIIVGFDASHLASNYSVQSLIFWLKTAPVGEGAVEINERGLYQLLDAKNDLDLEVL